MRVMSGFQPVPLPDIEDPSALTSISVATPCGKFMAFDGFRSSSEMNAVKSIVAKYPSIGLTRSNVAVFSAWVASIVPTSS